MEVRLIRVERKEIMAIMINCARDWTYDKFVEDLKTYGEDFNDTDNYNGYFIGYMKRSVKRFLEKWNRNHGGKLYVIGYGWAGDEFADEMSDWFSDFYKEAYGQRPHLPKWYYVHALGLPMGEDTARQFCADPVREACEEARETRRML